MKLKILVVDDSLFRLKWFEDIFSDHQVTVVKEYDNIVDKINKKFDLIFLDHDLGQNFSGYDIAIKISNSVNKNTFIVVHSWNYFGAKKIRSILLNSIYLPFGCISKKYILSFFDTKKYSLIEILTIVLKCISYFLGGYILGYFLGYLFYLLFHLK